MGELTSLARVIFNGLTRPWRGKMTNKCGVEKREDFVGGEKNEELSQMVWLPMERRKGEFLLCR